MDLSPALENVEKISWKLKSLTYNKKYKDCDNKCVMKSFNDKKKEEILNNCMDFINSIENQIEVELNKFDDNFFKKIDNRKSFLEKRLNELENQAENDSRKIEIIKEIEFYEKQNIRKFDQIVYNEEEAIKLAIKFHEEPLVSKNSHLKEFLSQHVKIDVESPKDKEIESYLKIISILNNYK